MDPALETQNEQRDQTNSKNDPKPQHPCRRSHCNVSLSGFVIVCVCYQSMPCLCRHCLMPPPPPLSPLVVDTHFFCGQLTREGKGPAYMTCGLFLSWDQTRTTGSIGFCRIGLRLACSRFGRLRGPDTTLVNVCILFVETSR